MKKLIIILSLFVLTVITFGQVVDTTHVSHEAQKNLLAWLLSQWTEHKGTILALLFAFVSELLGNTGKVKEGSVIAWVLNFIGRILNRKGDIIPTKKAKFMNLDQFNKARSAKVIMFAIILSGIGLTASAQGPFEGFFKPMKFNSSVQKMLSTDVIDKASNQDIWLFHPSIDIQGIITQYDKSTKLWSTSALSMGGAGITYAHVVEKDGKPYVQFGVNAIALMSFNVADPMKSQLSTVLGLQLFNLWSFGAGYNWGAKAPVICTGLSYKFNL